MATDGSGRSQRTLPSTPSIDDAGGWGSLLGALTDDELRRYAEIARDQRNIEYERWWAQVLLWVAAAASFGFAVWQLTVAGLTTLVVLAMLAAVAAGYWPYRKVQMRRLWQRHCEAVARELARRGTKAD